MKTTIVLVIMICMVQAYAQDRVRQIRAHCEGVAPTAMDACLDRYSKLALLENDQVAPILVTCKRSHTEPAAIESCVWNAIPDALKGELIAQLEEDNKRLRNNSSSVNLAGANLSTGSSFFRTTAGQQLEAYLKLRFAQGLYGVDNVECNPKVNDKGVTVNFCAPKHISQRVDRATYFDMHESLLTKQLIDGVASYCLEATPSTFAIQRDKTQRDAQIETNLNTMSQFSPDGDNVAKKNFSECFSAIPRICYDTASEEYSKNRACEVVTFMKQVRSALLAVLDIKEEMLNQASSDNVFEQLGVQLYDGTATGGRKTVNDMVSMSSNELTTEARFVEHAQSEIEEMKKCENGSEDNCDKFVGNITDKSEDQTLAVEEMLRGRVTREKLSTMTTEETRAFLISEGVQGVAGFSESKLQEIRTKISERFEAERNAIVDRINRQAGTGRYADGEEVNSATARGAVAEVRREFEEQAGNLSNLVQYSNIVAGYLEITSNTGVAQNTESIFRELNDLRVPDRRPAAAAAAAADAAQSDRIERLIQETERRVEAPTGNTNGNVMMGVDQINQVLKYND